MALFDVPKRAGREQDSSIAKSLKSTKKSTTAVRGSGLLGQINQIKAVVEKNLGQFKDDYIIITDEKQLHDYISSCIYTHQISQRLMFL